MSALVVFSTGFFDCIMQNVSTHCKAQNVIFLVEGDLELKDA